MGDLLLKLIPKGTEKIYPKVHTQDIYDKLSGKGLYEILSSFNMYFLPFIKDAKTTRLQVPLDLRREGLWITYVTLDHTVVTEWYNSDNIDDENFGSNTYWRKGSNLLVGDISISDNGNWVINGKETEFKATGDPIKPILRVNMDVNKLLVTYDNGKHYENLGDNSVYTLFRYNLETNTLLESKDLGKTWSNISEDNVFYKFRTSNNKLLVSTDLGETWTDTSEYIAAYFRWVDADNNGNLGKIQISRDNLTWLDMTPSFTNNLYIKGYVATVGDLPTSTSALGDIYMVGPTYNEGDTNNDYPHYRMWVKLSDGWVDNGEYTSVPAGITDVVTEDTNTVPSNKAVNTRLTELGEFKDNLLWLQVVTDSENNMLYGVNNKGIFKSMVGIEAPNINPTIDTPEYLYLMLDLEDNKIIEVKLSGEVSINDISIKSLGYKINNLQEKLQGVDTYSYGDYLYTALYMGNSIYRDFLFSMPSEFDVDIRNLEMIVDSNNNVITILNNKGELI